MKHLNVNCLDCDKPKYRATTTRYFQSPYCRSCAIKRRWRRDGKPPLKCVRCGCGFQFKESNGKPHLFCSKIYRSRKVKKQCPKCLTVFSVPLSNASRYNFCSLNCAHGPSVTRNCETCRLPFTLNASEARVRGRYCSFRCYRKSTKGSSIEKRIREILEIETVDFISEYKVPSSNKRDLFDFFVPRFNLLIECDGKYWHSLPGVKERDEAKTQRARQLGYRVERLSEDLIRSTVIHGHVVTLLNLQLPQ